MTTVLKHESEPGEQVVPAGPPSWGFAANLTPPELVIAARVRRLREWILLALCAVVLLAGGGYGYGFYRTHEADSALHAEQERTIQLRQQQARYAALVSLQDSVAKVRAQITTLMHGDVEADTLLDAIGRAGPPGVSLTSVSVSLAPASDGAAAGGQSLDTSGKKHIGTIEVRGTGTKIDDASAYVAALRKIPGVVDVFPKENIAQQHSTQFTITVNITEDRLSHRFDPEGPK